MSYQPPQSQKPQVGYVVAQDDYTPEQGVYSLQGGYSQRGGYPQQGPYPQQESYTPALGLQGQGYVPARFASQGQDFSQVYMQGYAQGSTPGSYLPPQAQAQGQGQGQGQQQWQGQNQSYNSGSRIFMSSTTFQMHPPTFTMPQTTIYQPQVNLRVPYTPIHLKADSNSHVLKAIHSSTKSAASLINIIGSYVEQKTEHESKRLATGTLGEYHRSRPEIQMYNHLMHKLETLSGSVMAERHGPPPEWNEAFAPFRRQVFADLHNSNHMVRCFAKELNGYPSILPHLNKYALGITRTDWSFPKAALRPPVRTAQMELLAQVRTVVLVDDSGSMSEAGHNSWSSRSEGGYNANESRWNQVQSLLAGVAPLVSQHNRHGIDIHFLNRTQYFDGVHTAQQVQQAFQTGYPDGGTPTGHKVNEILDAYMSTLRYDHSLMPVNLIVFTDGEAQDEETLHWSIEEHVSKIMHRGFPAHQLGIEFVQVGDCQWAMRHLQKLENEVTRHHRKYQRDIVGVTEAGRASRMNADVLLAIALSGVDARMNGYMRQRAINI